MKTPKKEPAKKYAMVIEPMVGEEGEYFCAYFPDLPGCTTMGRDLDDLTQKAKEAVEQHLECLRETGQPLPEPKSRTAFVSVFSPRDRAAG